MKCKLSNVATVLRHSKHAGRLVEVLYEAPPEPFTLPDGHQNVGVPRRHWAVRSHGSPMEAPLRPRGKRLAIYGAGPDEKLCPLKGTRAPSTLWQSPADG
jgi:hypothetical protein